MNEIFRKNLTENEYQELVMLLSTHAGALSEDGWNKINQYYYLIAKNTMTEEEYIEFEFEHSSNIVSKVNDIEGEKKYYFNSRKMIDTEVVTYITDQKFIKTKYLSVEEYVVALKEGRNVEYRDYDNSKVEINGDRVTIITDNGNLEMSLIDAVRGGYFAIYFKEYIEISEEEYLNLSVDEKSNIHIEGENKSYIKESFKKEEKYQINSNLTSLKSLS